jgi:hypothetical protein
LRRLWSSRASFWEDCLLGAQRKTGHPSLGNFGQKRGSPFLKFLAI